MRKILLSAAAALLLSTAASAQSASLSEGFEGSTVPPEGWTVRSCSDASTNKYKWEQSLYTSNPLNLRKGYTHGGKYAMMVSSGKTTTTKPAPDSWLISPQVEVKSGDNLSFMLAYAPVFNQGAAVKAADRIKFAVLVSTSDTAKASFTETLYEIQPYKDTDWHQLCLDLSKYAGQKVYVAFREYGSSTTGAVTYNRLWIDDVKVSQTATSDIIATELLAPVAGPATSQKVSLKYTNAALANTSLSFGYSVNGVEGKTETLAADYACATGDTLTYTFSVPATLNTGNNTVKAWATAANDGNHDNDTLTATVKIDEVFALPYEMNSSNNSNGWTYTYHSGKVSRGTNKGWWQVPNSDASAQDWTYNGPVAQESLLEGKWFALDEGPANITLTYTSGTEAPLTLSLVDVTTGSTVASTTATLASAETEATQKVSVSAPAAGSYKLTLKCGDTYVGPLAITKLAISKAAAIDVEVADVAIDSAIVAGHNYPLVVKVKNNGSSDVANVAVKLTVDDAVVAEDVIPAIASEQTIDWTIGSGSTASTFAGLNLAAGSHTIAVTATAEGDAEAGNNTAQCDVVAYNAYTIPFAESFESILSRSCWNAKSLGDNVLNWTTGTAIVGTVNWAKDGQNAAYMSSVAGTEHNAVLYSPVIKADKAQALRLSYFYTTRMNATSATNKTMLTATVRRVDDGSKAVVAQHTDTITDANVGVYHQGYALVNIPAEGEYQIEFLNTGMGHDVVLDDIRLDACKDVAAITAQQTGKSGYNNTTTDVTLTFANHGAVALDNVALTLVLTPQKGEGFTKKVNYDATVAAGDTVSYTFSGIDISTPDTYDIAVAATLPSDDAELANDSLHLASIVTYANGTIPYVADFDDADQQAQWTLEGTWQTGTYSSSSAAYNGTGAISHHKKATDTAGDWAYSGCIEVPAGTYSMSFFYRTFLNGKSQATYGQNFEVYLGTDRTPEAMTQKLYASATKVLVYDKRYKRVEGIFTVPEDGKYYIGVKCTSTTNYGVLYFDNLEIDETSTTAPLIGDYTTTFDEYYRYDPSSQFSQWAADSETESQQATQKIFNAGNPSTELPGIMVSRAYTFEAGRTYTATLTYAMSAADAANLSDEAKAQMKTVLYLSEGDTLATEPTILAEGIDVSGDKATVTATFTMPEVSVRHFIVGVEGPKNCTTGSVVLTYNLYGLTLSSVPTGIHSAAAISGKVALYNANGMKLGEYATAAEAMKHAAKGVGIIKPVAGGAAVKVVK